MVCPAKEHACVCVHSVCARAQRQNEIAAREHVGYIEGGIEGEMYMCTGCPVASGNRFGRGFSTWKSANDRANQIIADRVVKIYS